LAESAFSGSAFGVGCGLVVATVQASADETALFLSTVKAGYGSV